MDAFDSSIFDVEAGENGVVVQLDGTSPNIMINISDCIDSDNPLSKVDYSIEGDEMELPLLQHFRKIWKQRYME